MILTALSDYYNVLAANPENKINIPGWQFKKVGFAILINPEGELLDILPLAQEETQTDKKGKAKTVKIAQEFLVPNIDRSGSGLNPIYLCDKAEYVLGIGSTLPKGSGQSDENKSQRLAQQFQASGELYQKLFEGCESIEATALLNFYKYMTVEKISAHPKILPYKNDKDFLSANFIFKLEHGGADYYLHDNPELKAIWNRFRNSHDTADTQTCLITGEKKPTARLHPKIKGLYGGQAAGSSLIGYNSNAFEYFNKQNGDISPISEEAADAYGSVLSWLLRRENNHVTHMGNVSIMYWSKNGNVDEDTMIDLLFNPPPDDDTALKGFFDRIITGNNVNANIESELSSPFYVLGISPNNARIAVKFFIANSFGYFLENIKDHFANLEIIGDNGKYLSARDLISETVNKNSSNKSPKEDLSIALLKSILQGYRYPPELIHGMLSRLRVEINGDETTAKYAINYRRVAMIKAYLIRNTNYKKEMITVALNKDWDNTAYLLGRLFAACEKIQEDAPGGNATIKGKYFTAASTNPASIFPSVMKLAHVYLARIENPGFKINAEKTLGSIMVLLEAKPYPKNLSFEEQNVFTLGYYHQRQEFFTSKKDKKEEENLPC